MERLEGWEKLVKDSLAISAHNKKRVHGGDINEAFSFTSGDQKYFIKYQIGPQASSMFQSEAEGLRLIATKKCIKTPSPVQRLEGNNEAALIMPFIEKGNPSTVDWERFGHQLGALHRHTNSTFGLNTHNYIGTLQQNNSQTNSWTKFYAEQRILPLLNQAFDRGMLGMAEVRNGERFCRRIASLFPDEKPSLIHGDLWSGNFLFDQNRTPYLIDPAVYYGHREMDLAMSRLFGGFPKEFYQGYEENHPLSSGWQVRLKYGQLYYLLVHLVLFGKAYFHSVAAILDEF